MIINLMIFVGHYNALGQICFVTQIREQICHETPVNDRKCVFHFRPKPKPKSEKHLVFGRIPKPKPKVQIYVKKGGNFAKFQVSNDISN